MSETDPDQEKRIDGLGGFTVSLGEFGYITKKYEKELKEFQEADAADEGGEFTEGNDADGDADADAGGDADGEEKEGSTNIAPRLPNDYPTAWARCSVSVDGSANTDDIWHPADQAVRITACITYAPH